MVSFRQLVEDWPTGNLTEGTVAHRLILLREHPARASLAELLEAVHEVKQRHGGRMNYEAAIHLDDLIRNLDAQLNRPTESAEATPAA